MNSNLHLLKALILLVLLSSCEEESNSIYVKPILTSFTEPFPKKGYDITRVLGNELSLQTNNSTKHYLLDYYSADRSTVIRTVDGDTLYNGPISRYRGLYFLTETSPDSTFWISCFEVNDDNVIGFLQREKLLRLIDDSFSFYFEKPSEKPSYLTKCSEDGITFITEEKILKNLFNAFINKLETETILAVDEETTVDDSDTITYIDQTVGTLNFIEEYLPNPVDKNLTLKFLKSGKYHIDIRTAEGDKLEDFEFKGDITEIDFTNKSAGVYLISVTKRLRKSIDTIKVVKK